MRHSQPDQPDLVLKEEIQPRKTREEVRRVYK